ncbi:serrate RNA effector molecule homolog isoform X2 [Xenia sp. Carnegie-2017]|uniref:serrate RNA effector molecule homolog isoform X2 n=1 Tax=Xenia sp. Carnegie-2017 TaxID=2897299 RepID=UPI001F03E244|nr:serrate RNA effector molecule homolog isoform X2 [Xenia sp. Carnegie-2017]
MQIFPGEDKLIVCFGHNQFRNKYHPVEADLYKKKVNSSVRKRASVFVDLLQLGWVDRYTLTAEQGEEITKLLDAAVIKFEGGTDFDLQVLDENYKEREEARLKEKSAKEKQIAVKDGQTVVSQKPTTTPPSSSSTPLPDTVAPTTDGEVRQENTDDLIKADATKNDDVQPEEGKTRKRKRRNRDNFDDDENEESESESDTETDPVGTNKDSNNLDNVEKVPEGTEKPSTAEVSTEEVADKTEENSVAATNDETRNEEGNLKSEENCMEETKASHLEEKVDKTETCEGNEEKKDEQDGDGESDNGESKEEHEITTPRALHLTVSLFVRNVSPKIFHNDIDSACARYDGYMRVVLSDPAPDKKFFRRGWITFKPNVNIKDICWSLNNIKVKDVELHALVNRELAKRVRTVSGSAVLKGWVESDITMATRLILALDEKYEVWKQEEKEEIKEMEVEKTDEKGEDKPETTKTEEVSGEVPQEKKEENTEESEKKLSKVVTKINMPHSNPVLESLPSKISEKVAAISESITAGKQDETVVYETSEGEKVPGLEGSQHPPPEIDESLVKLLDRLVLYLRIVHSMDYYSGAEYLYEDDMPNRCGIIHIRSPLPDKVNYEEVTDWHKNLHQKLELHLQKKEKMPDSEALLLGKKDQEKEVEKFVEANTQEIGQDKWLCPLSGKKFRGPEFVRKHIFNKHGEKVDDVKTEVNFFNNFVYDPKRPCEGEVKSSSVNTHVQQGYHTPQQLGMHNNQGGWGRGGNMHYGNRGGYNNYGNNFNNYNRGGFQRPRRGSFGGGPRHDSRPILQYRDLDAPGDDNDFF